MELETRESKTEEAQQANEIRGGVQSDIDAFKEGERRLFAEIERMKKPPSSFEALVSSIASFIVPPRNRSR